MYFVNEHVIKNVVVIGAGGTGSRLIPQLVQFIKTVPIFEQLEYPKVYLFDDDTVETKNLTRQLFIKPDVGHYKASALANRYEKAYNFPIIDVNIKFQDVGQHTEATEEELYRARRKEILVDGGNPDGVRRNEEHGYLNFFYSNRYTVYIICIDSVEDRFKIFNMIATLAANDKYMIIDAGNENTFGQVSNFQLKAYTEPTYPDSDKVVTAYNNSLEQAISESYTAIKDLKSSGIPFPWNLYIGREESEINCADLDQTLAVNSLMASGIMLSFQNLALMNPIKVSTTYYNLNGIHTQDVLSLSNFKAMSDNDIRSLTGSGLRNGLEKLTNEFCSQVNTSEPLDTNSDLANKRLSLRLALRLLRPANERRSRVDNWKLKADMVMLESAFYDYYIQNGIGFREMDGTSRFFWQMLNIWNMKPDEAYDRDSTEINFTINLYQVCALIMKKTGQDGSQIIGNLREILGYGLFNRPIINISAKVSKVYYLNLVASYLLNVHKHYSDPETQCVINASLIKAAGIPMLSSEICEPNERRPDRLEISDSRYRAMENTDIPLSIYRSLTTSLVNQVETFFKYLGKYSDIKSILSEGTFSVNSIYVNKYAVTTSYRGDPLTVPMEESDQYSTLKKYTQDALEYFFSSLTDVSAAELLDTSEVSENPEGQLWFANQENEDEDQPIIHRTPFFIPYEEIDSQQSDVNDIRLEVELHRYLVGATNFGISPLTRRVAGWLQENETYMLLIEQGYTIGNVEVQPRYTYVHITLLMNEPQMGGDETPHGAEFVDEGDDPADPPQGQNYAENFVNTTNNVATPTFIDTRGGNQHQTNITENINLTHVRGYVARTVREYNDLTLNQRSQIHERVIDNLLRETQFVWLIEHGYHVRDIGVTRQDGRVYVDLRLGRLGENNLTNIRINTPEDEIEDEQVGNPDVNYLRDMISQGLEYDATTSVERRDQIRDRILNNVLNDTQVNRFLERGYHIINASVDRTGNDPAVNIRFDIPPEDNAINMTIHSAQYPQQEYDEEVPHGAEAADEEENDIAEVPEERRFNVNPEFVTPPDWVDENTQG